MVESIVAFGLLVLIAWREAGPRPPTLPFEIEDRWYSHLVEVGGRFVRVETWR